MYASGGSSHSDMRNRDNRQYLYYSGDFTHTHMPRMHTYLEAQTLSGTHKCEMCVLHSVTHTHMFRQAHTKEHNTTYIDIDKPGHRDKHKNFVSCMCAHTKFPCRQTRNKKQKK